jgi:hypothetical protein
VKETASLILKFDLTRAEFIEAGVARFRFLLTALGISAVWFAIVALQSILEEPNTRGPHFLIFIIAIMAIGSLAFGFLMTTFMRFLLLPWRYSTLYRQNPFFYREIEVSIADDGIAFASPKTSSRWQWPDFTGFKESRALFLLCPSKSYSIILPKRILAMEQQDEIRKLLTGKLRRL